MARAGHARAVLDHCRRRGLRARERLDRRRGRASRGRHRSGSRRAGRAPVSSSASCIGPAMVSRWTKPTSCACSRPAAARPKPCAGTPTSCGRGERRSRQLRGQSQHQLHQRLLLPLPLLRVLQGQARRASARRCPTRWISRRSRAAPAKPGSGARPRSACRAASTRTTPGRPISTSAGRSKRRRRRSTCTPSRRSRCGRARARSGCRCANSSPSSGAPASARCPAPPPRSWTTRCAA